MNQRLSGRRVALVLTTSLTVVSTALLTAPPALAGGSHGHGGSGGSSSPPWTVIASGLDNPRQLTVEQGYGHDYGRRHHGGGYGGGHSKKTTLYVAEAGRGGSGTCITGPEGDQTCFGLSGAVTRIGKGQQSRVVTGLPSLAAADGSQAIGPADVLVRGSWYAVTVGLGTDPANRDTVAGGEKLGTLQAGRFGGGQVTLSDLAASEAANDPDGVGPDSNPTGLAAAHRGFVLTDSGANALQSVDWRGNVTTLATFAERLVPPPPFFPPDSDDISMQAVPTSVVRGPDGAWYVSQLTGFPFPAGGANIFRVVPGLPPTVYASGLTNVTDLAWSGHKLYAVQLAGNGGLLAAGEDLPVGTLERINYDGTHTTVVGDLPAPYGVAIDGGNAYVTTCSVCAGGGGVVRIPLK